MKALLFTGRGVELRDKPRPAPSRGEILLRVTAATICSSDLKIIEGVKSAKPGVILGHEVEGIVFQNLSDKTTLKEGDRVAVFPSIFCGKCHYCLHGYPHLCLHKKTMGYVFDGGFAEYLLIPPPMVEEGALLDAEIIPPGYASLLEPLATVLASVKRANLKGDETIAIYGAGAMGLMHILLLKSLFGDARIITVEPSELRRKRALSFGSDFALDPSDSEEILERTQGLGTDVSFLTTASPAALVSATRLTKKRGRIVAFSSYRPGCIASEVLQEIHYGERVILGVHSAPLEIFRETAEVVISRGVPLERLITHRFGLQEYREAFETAQKPEAIKVAFLP